MLEGKERYHPPQGDSFFCPSACPQCPSNRFASTRPCPPKPFPTNSVRIGTHFGNQFGKPPLQPDNPSNEARFWGILEKYAAENLSIALLQHLLDIWWYPTSFPLFNPFLPRHRPGAPLTPVTHRGVVSKACRHQQNLASSPQSKEVRECGNYMELLCLWPPVRLQRLLPC